MSELSRLHGSERYAACADESAGFFVAGRMRAVLASYETRCAKNESHYPLHFLKTQYAGIAHLVERRLAKAEVAGSSPVSRSNKNSTL